MQLLRHDNRPGQVWRQYVLVRLLGEKPACDAGARSIALPSSAPLCHGCMRSAVFHATQLLRQAVDLHAQPSGRSMVGQNRIYGLRAKISIRTLCPNPLDAVGRTIADFSFCPRWFVFKLDCIAGLANVRFDQLAWLRVALSW